MVNTFNDLQQLGDTDHLLNLKVQTLTICLTALSYTSLIEKKPDLKQINSGFLFENVPEFGQSLVVLPHLL